jgi:putative peptidoglycan lipid II flippase
VDSAESTPAAGPTADGSSTARGSITVAAWTLVSRVAGLARVLVIGALLGPTYFANIFQAGFVLPNTVFTVLAGPVLAMVIVPAFVHAVSVAGAGRAREIAGRVAGRLLAIAAGCAVVLAVVSPAIAWLLVVAVPEAERARAWLLGIVLILFVAPQVPLYAIIGLGVAAQQGRHRFALSAAAPAVESLGTIATLVVAVSVFGSGLEVARAPVAMMVLLGLGNTVAVALHAVLQCYGAARVGMFSWPRRGWRDDPQAAEALRRLARSIPVAACPAVTNYALIVLAATVPGGVVIVQLSYQVFYALSFVGARAVSMAALPGLADAATAGDLARFGTAWRRGLHYAAVASLPSLALLVAFAAPTADLLSNGDMRQPALIAGLASCLTVVALAQLAGGVHDYARQALFARFDDRGPRWAVTIGAVTSLAIGASTLLVPAAEARLTGLVVALLAGETAAAATVLSRLAHRMRPEALVDRSTLTAPTAALALLLPIAAGWWLLDTTHPDRWLQLPLLLGIGVVALATFALALRLAGRRIEPQDRASSNPSTTRPRIPDEWRA